MRSSIANKITQAAARDKKIFLIAGDGGYGVLDEFQRKFPKRFLNLGVAEQNTISFAAGLGLMGFKVFVYNIVPFVLYRCYEQIRNDICYQRVPVTLIGIGSGVTYAPQGVTHYSVEDIAIARTLPNLTVLSPSDPKEAIKCAEYAVKSKGPVYIRIAKSGEPVIHKGRVTDITKPVVVQKGNGVAVLFHGSISIEVMEALRDLGKSPLVLSVPMVQPLDYDFLLKRLKKVHTIITVEEHYADGGLGSAVAEWIAKEGHHFRLKRLGLKNKFIHDIMKNQGLRKLYGISADSIRQSILKSYHDG
jgi:transketolase